MAHGDAREGKWRGNWRMDWVATTLTLPWNVVCPALLTLLRTPRPPAVDWTDAPGDWNGLVRFRRKMKNGFSACAIMFQMHCIVRVWSKNLVMNWNVEFCRLEWLSMLQILKAWHLWWLHACLAELRLQLFFWAWVPWIISQTSMVIQHFTGLLTKVRSFSLEHKLQENKVQHFSSWFIQNFPEIWWSKTMVYDLDEGLYR